MYGPTAYEETFTQKYFLKLHNTTKVCGIWTKILSPHSKLHKMGTPPDWHRQKHKVLTPLQLSGGGLSSWERQDFRIFILPPDTCCWDEVLGKCN